MTSFLNYKFSHPLVLIFHHNVLSGSLRSPPHQIFNLLWESKIYLSHVQLGPRPPTPLPTPTVPRLQSLHFQQLSTTYRVKAEHGSGWQAERATIQPFLATLPHALGPATVNHSRAHSRGHTFSCLHTVTSHCGTLRTSLVCLEASRPRPQHRSHDPSFERLSREPFTLLALSPPHAQGT